MKSITVKHVPDEVHARLRQRAKLNHRRLNGELLDLLETATANPPRFELDGGSLSDFLLDSPLCGSGIEIDRDPGVSREIEL